MRIINRSRRIRARRETCGRLIFVNGKGRPNKLAAGMTATADTCDHVPQGKRIDPNGSFVRLVLYGTCDELARWKYRRFERFGNAPVRLNAYGKRELQKLRERAIARGAKLWVSETPIAPYVKTDAPKSYAYLSEAKIIDALVAYLDAHQTSGAQRLLDKAERIYFRRMSARAEASEASEASEP